MSVPTCERLLFRPLSPDVLPHLFGLRCDPQVMQFWDWPADDSIEQTRETLEHVLAEIEAGEALHWSVWRGSDDQFVGCCDLSDLQPGGSADVGFMLTPRHWGSGLGREVLQALIRHARVLGLTVLEARIHSANSRSSRLLIGCGFTELRSAADHEIRPGVRRACTWFERPL